MDVYLKFFGVLIAGAVVMWISYLIDILPFSGNHIGKAFQFQLFQLYFEGVSISLYLYILY